MAAFIHWAHENTLSRSFTVVVTGDHVIGLARLATVARPPSSGAPVRLCGDVQSVYVTPEKRGRGVGRRLSQHGMATAAARGLEHLTVHSSARAVPLYIRAGFTVDARLLLTPLRT